MCLNGNGGIFGQFISFFFCWKTLRHVAGYMLNKRIPPYLQHPSRDRAHSKCLQSEYKNTYNFVVFFINKTLPLVNVAWAFNLLMSSRVFFLWRWKISKYGTPYGTIIYGTTHLNKGFDDSLKEWNNIWSNVGNKYGTLYETTKVGTKWNINVRLMKIKQKFLN